MARNPAGITHAVQGATTEARINGNHGRSPSLNKDLISLLCSNRKPHQTRHGSASRHPMLCGTCQGLKAVLPASALSFFGASAP